MAIILQWVIFGFILYKLITKARKKPRATADLNFGRLSEPFWYVITVIFVLIWAGIFWW